MQFFEKSFFFFFFSLLPLFSNPNPSYLSIEELLLKGSELADNEQYSESLRVLNQAMGMLKEIPREHPLRLETEKLIRLTKGRSLVARYRKGKLKAYSDPNALQPLESETREFKASQVFGKVLARKVWEPRDDIRPGHSIGLGRRITVLPNGGIELTSSSDESTTLRTVQASSFDLANQNSFVLHSGSYVLHTTSKNQKMTISSPLADIEIHSSDPFAVMIGVTTNGGMKIINLLGSFDIKSGRNKLSMVPGELSFALPEGFSRKMNVELSTLIVTSNLLTDFEKPPVFLKKLRQQAMMQALRTRKRFRTVVGDVKSNENFELKVLKEEPR